jgi:pyruvate/2-oxoglutarate/acetoin dehydrogenase E1 component
MPEQENRKLSYMLAIREALREEMRADPSVLLIGEDLARHGGGFGVTKELWEEFGSERVRNTPISENSFVGIALGASMTGLRPVVELMFMDFVMVAMDQICNEAAKVRYMYGGQAQAPMVIRCPQGGLSWKSAAAQHSQSLEAWFVHTPGLKVVFPSNAYDAKGLLKSAIRDNNPVVFIEHKALYGIEDLVPNENYLIPLGEGKIVRPGKDITLIASGYMVHFAQEAAIQLEEVGIEAEIIDPRTLKPLDEELFFQSIKKTHRAVIVQEANKNAGLGMDWCARIQENCFDWLDAPIQVLAGADVPVPYASSIENRIYVGVEEIFKSAREICYR